MLAPEGTCRIGRAEESDVFVPDVGVSRCHADIRWEGDAFVIADLGSANGTFVNGERVTERVLAHGDEIRVGPLTLGFRVEEADGVDASRRARTRHVRELDTAVSRSPFARGIAGGLADVPISEVVQLLERARKTGRLRVGRAGWRGSLSFREGRIVTAEWADPDGGRLAGSEAAYALLALEEGDFDFIAEAVLEEASMAQPVQALLLETMRRADESSRPGRLPEDNVEDGQLNDTLA